MISAISSVSSLYTTAAQPSQGPAAPQKQNEPHDTVQLSQAARATAGDVARDGDSR
ncbi:MAG TPA: hypothetical protein VKX49_12315 [Bryobacteraceae bacterium]|nr:hypothetical protein [Bryobacteraceae bacterium]